MLLSNFFLFFLEFDFYTASIYDTDMIINNISVGQQNKKNVYKAILQEDKITRIKVAEKLKLSLPTVALNIKQLMSEGLVKEDGELFSTGGRKASAVSSIADARLSVGIDITQNHIGFAIVNLKGEVVAHIRRTQKFSDSPEYAESVYGLFLSFLADTAIQANRILGVGVSVPGIVDSDNRTLKYSHRLGIFEPRNLTLLEKIHFQTIVFNDATAAGMAELSKSAELKNMVFLSLSNSVGGAFIIDGKCVQGTNMHSGEFGHLYFIPGGKQCYCNYKGHFDSYGSALVLSTAANGSLQDFFKKLAMNDAIYTNIFNEYIKNLSIMICNLHTIFDLPIVLGGYVGSYLLPYLDIIRKEVENIDMFKEPASYIKICSYKNEASAVGAALHFINMFIEHI